jgi:hypothetical protein
MTEAEILHRRKMQLKNDVVKPLLNLIDRGLDVPYILQDLTRQEAAGNGLDGKKWAQSGHSKRK